MNVQTAPALLDVAGALEALPDLSLGLAVTAYIGHSMFDVGDAAGISLELAPDEDTGRKASRRASMN